MAYNSDGYIMLDFADVDFRQANQYIEGLYDRMVQVVGTNKFVIVINANNKTPLPSTVSITNNQYVIESCLYSFSVNSSDMLHITKHANVDDIIDDDHIALTSTYSSYKIVSILNTAVNGIIKTFKYTGNGSGGNWIQLPDNCHYILSIWGWGFTYSQYNMSKTDGFVLIDNVVNNSRTWLGDESGWGSTSGPIRTKYDASQNKVYLQSGTAAVFASNESDITYTVYYI